MTQAIIAASPSFCLLVFCYAACMPVWLFVSGSRCSYHFLTHQSIPRVAPVRAKQLLPPFILPRSESGIKSHVPLQHKSPLREMARWQLVRLRVCIFFSSWWNLQIFSFLLMSKAGKKPDPHEAIGRISCLLAQKICSCYEDLLAIPMQSGFRTELSCQAGWRMFRTTVPSFANAVRKGDTICHFGLQMVSRWLHGVDKLSISSEVNFMMNLIICLLNMPVVLVSTYRLQVS